MMLCLLMLLMMIGLLCSDGLLCCLMVVKNELRFRCRILVLVCMFLVLFS